MMSTIAHQLHAVLLAQAAIEPNAVVRRLLLEQAEAALSPIGEQVQAWPDAMREREAGLAAACQSHAEFLGPAVVRSLARREAAEIEAHVALLNAASRPR